MYKIYGAYADGTPVRAQTTRLIVVCKCVHILKNEVTRFGFSQDACVFLQQACVWVEPITFPLQPEARFRERRTGRPADQEFWGVQSQRARPI